MHLLSSGEYNLQHLKYFYRLFPKIVEIQALMKYYDVNGDGHLSYEEFIKVLREPLNERRNAIVQKAWAHLAGEGAAKVGTETAINALGIAGDRDF